MKTDIGKLLRKSLPLAILLALSPAVLAQSDDDVANLTQPTNYLEFGLGYLSQDSAQFGQYNGLDSSGPYLLGNLGLAGGNAYGQGSGTRAWSILATNLGTTSRSFDARARDQGKWYVGLSFDQLRHHISDDYQTPLQGKMGGNIFTMPAGFGVVSAARPSTPDTYGTRILTPTQQAYFHRVKVYTERQNSTVALGYNFNTHWNARFEWNHLKQSGAKLLSTGTDENATSTGFTMAGYDLRGEAIQVLMNPTDYTTDNLDLKMNWNGSRAFMTVGVHASHFHDNNATLNFPNPYTTTAVANGTLLPGPYPVDAMSTPPSNNFNQANLSGGYNFTTKTRLVGSYSYGRNTQNEAYVNLDQMQPGGLPATSLHGKVILTHMNLRLTNRTTRALSLSADATYNKRDNRTPAYAYSFFDLGAGARTAVNIPLSYSKTRSSLGADYRFGRTQHLHAAYEYEKTRRWCNSALSNQAQGVLTAANLGYYTTASCVQVPKNTEDRFVLTYRASPTDTLDLHAGYTYADRKATVNSAFYNPMQSNSQGFENYGYRAYFDASRNRHLFKAGLQWQVASRVSIGLDGRGSYDKYTDSPLGVQHGHSASLNLDVSYIASARASASFYATGERRSRYLLSAHDRSAVSPPVELWSNALTDSSDIVGIRAQRSGMMHGKLKLGADLSYSLDRTRYSTEVYYPDSSCTTPGRTGYDCGTLPDIRTRLTRLNLTASYALDHKSTLVFGYLYQKLATNDYFYNYYQLGYTGTTTMPTNQLSPNYTENLVYAAFRFSFL